MQKSPKIAIFALFKIKNFVKINFHKKYFMPFFFHMIEKLKNSILKENSENPQGLEVEIWALLNRRTSSF